MFFFSFLLIFFLGLFLLIFFEVKCVVDRYKLHRPFQRAMTVLRNDDPFKWQRPFTKGKFASLTQDLCKPPVAQSFVVSMSHANNDLV